MMLSTALLLLSSFASASATAPPACCASLGAAPPALDNCGGSRPVGAPFATRSPVLSTRGQVASAHPLASDAGLDMLKAGGSAVDAAIATNAVLAVLEPMMNGPGGDLMAIVWDEAGGKIVGYNGAGRAPQGRSYDDMAAALAALNATTIPTVGPLAVTVPGAVRGWCDLHARFGKLPWASVFAPAIAVALRGAPTPPVIAYEWAPPPAGAAATSGGAFPHALDGWGAVFGSPRPAPRALFRNPALAATLEALAAGGCDAFYAPGGALAAKLVAMAGATGLRLEAADLAAHVGEWVTPINATFGGATVFQLPPNPQGAAALEMLNVLEGLNFSAGDFNSADYLHAHIEAKKLAFADASAFFADPAFAAIPLAGIISKPYAAAQRGRIDMARAARTDAPGQPPWGEAGVLPGGGASAARGGLEGLEAKYGGDTTYLTASDSSGMVVSWIQSLYTGFGSGLVDPGLGFALQSRGALFSMERGHPNVYAPGKRPFHTIMPGVAAKGASGGAGGAGEVPPRAPWVLSYGVMGGFMQPQGHAQVLYNLLVHGMNVQEAGDAARYYHSGSTTPTGVNMTDGGVVQLEAGVCDATVAELQRRGHNVVRGSNAGGYQAILRTPLEGGGWMFEGGTEMRKDGAVAAF